MSFSVVTMGQYAGRRVLVTGGLGFLGSNLALALHRAGARVMVVDSLVAGCGGSIANLGGAARELRVEIADIAEVPKVWPLLENAEIVFNLAAEISHSADTRMAERDLSLNVSSQLAFLGLCAEARPGIRVVYTSTRQVYGAPLYLPVDERHPVQPIDFNGVHKQAASHYHLLMTRMGKLDAVVLNLTNIYGPRLALDVPGQGFLAQYVAQALRGNGLKIFGDGSQTRDPLFVEDAVEAILLAGLAPLSEHRVFNVGHPEVWALRDIAMLVSEIAGLPAPEFIPFPENRRAIDIGSYATDTRLTHSVLGWQASTRLPDGIRMTLKHYGENAGAQVGSSVAGVRTRQSDSLCQSA
jgi:UDP-glucose 4-epimerase